MLNYLLYIILHMLVSTCFSTNSSDYNLQNFLKDKIQFLNRELNIEVFDNIRVKRGTYKNFMFLSNGYIPIDTITPIHIFNLFNTNYMFNGSLYEINPGEAYFSLNEVSNITIPVENKIDFIRSIYHNDIQYISICLKNGISNIYLAKNLNEINPIQYIKNPDEVKNSKFFINNRKLYLVTTSNLGTSLAVTSIFEWMGTYFDKVVEAFQKNVNSIFTFSSDDSEIIVILENSTWKGKSSMYQFKNDRLVKIQLLETTNPHQATKYIFDNHIYLIIFNEDSASLYKLNGLELHHLGHYPLQTEIEKIHVSYADNIPLLFIVSKGNIAVYNPVEDFKLLTNHSLDNKSEFEEIYAIETMKFGEKHFLYFFGKTKDGVVELHSMEFTVYSTETDKKVYESEPLTSCLSELEEKLDNDRKQLKMAKEDDIKVLPIVEKAIEFRSSNETSAAIQEYDTLDELETNITEKYLEALNRLKKIKSDVNDLFEPSVGILGGRLIIFGDFKCMSLQADKIGMKTLNSNKWEPERWLSYNTPQIITGNIKAKQIVARKVATPTDLFTDVLMLHGNQQLAESTFKSLRSTQLYTDDINGIPITDLFFKGSGLIINGIKTFHNVECDELDVDYINNQNASNISKYFTDGYHFNSSVDITNLEVETINGIHWNTFKDSLFKNGSNNRITGNLIVKNLKVKNLNLQSINNIDPRNILDAVTEQKIRSKMRFSTINSTSVDCTNINGINLDEDVVKLTDAHKSTTGPITLNSMLVRNDLYVNSTNSQFAKSEATKKGSKFRQFYKKVKIIGNVRMENLRLHPNTTMKIDGKRFSLDEIPKKFWLKHTDQTIAVHPKILNGITTPSIVTRSLNNVEIDKYMINDLGNRSFTTFAFKKVIVLGNVTINNSAEHMPDIVRLNENAVKITGSFEISGKKAFLGNLTVNKAKVDYLDDISTEDVISIHSQEISGKKRFKNLTIKGNLTARHSHIRQLNGIELDTIYQQFLTTNHPVQLESLTIKDITVDEMETVFMNGKNLNKYILDLDNLFAINTLDKAEIVGNIAGTRLIDVTFLNGVNINLIREKLADEIVMVGKVGFSNEVSIKNLKVENINNVNITNLGNNLIYKQFPNKITAKPRFKILRTSSLLCNSTNNLDMTGIINIEEKRVQTLKLKKKLILKSPTFMKSLSGNLPCNVQKIVDSIRNPPTTNWSRIQIFKNASIEETDHVLSSMLENAVTIGKDNNITAPVTFSHVSSKHVYSKKHINDVDIEKVYNDALLKTSHHEIITGTKTFNKLTTADAVVYGDAKIPTINKLLIEKIDKGIIYKDQISKILIKGPKTFDNVVQTKTLITKELLGINPENIVSLDDLGPIPFASFDNLHVLHNLKILNVNGTNFTQFLQNRMLKNSDTKQVLSGVYYFGNMHIMGESQIPLINQVNLTDVVFDAGIQNISELKEFSQDLVIYGHIQINTLNGMNISEKYGNAILTDEETEIDNIVFEGVARANNISTRNLNGIPVELIKARLQSETLKIKASIARDTINAIRDVIETNKGNAENLPTDYMYLDKYHDFTIAIPNAINAQAIEASGHVMIHVLSEEPGYKCNLPSSCKCFTQNMVQITPELSWHLFTNKGFQRIYSYEDQLLTVHVITDSISYSHECQRMNNSSSAELTTLTWIYKKTSNSFLFKPDEISGYISNADFFPYNNNNVYIILTNLYDDRPDRPTSHCLVLRLNVLQNLVEVIWRIPTTTSVVTHVFRTAQDVNLIIGNAFEDKRLGTIGTAIYKFDYQTEKFWELRTINGTQCISATSVVLGADSFIILAQKDNHVSTWKYNHVYNNYYFYQNLKLDYPATSVSTFYTNDFGVKSDAFISVVTRHENFYIYRFRYAEGWKLVSQGELEGLRLLTPFNLNKRTYLFAPFATISSLLTPVKHGQD